MGAEVGSMLRLPRRRAGAGSFKPRNDGPLITGLSSAAGALGGAGAGGTEDGTGVDAVTTLRAGALVTALGVCKSVAPHMPQKRFVAGFSLPQRAQRKDPPQLYIAYDNLEIRCSMKVGGGIKRGTHNDERVWRGCS